MSLFLKSKSDITDSRAIPIHAIELYGGPDTDDLHFYIRSLGGSSVWGLEEIFLLTDRRQKRPIAYKLTAVGYVVYNDWWEEEYAKQFERLSFGDFVDCNIHLEAHDKQPGRGEMSVSMKDSTVRDWSVSFKIPEQNNTKFPKLVVTIDGLFSIDGVKGFTERVDLDPNEKHFFTKGAVW